MATPRCLGSGRSMKIAIIGAGFAGLGLAIKLKQSGEEDFVILERAGALGGTWRDNVYPGCQCDVPSNLYSFSFMPNPRWTRTFPTQPEILDYLRHCVDGAIPPGPWDGWLERAERDPINIERAALLRDGRDEMPPSMLKAIGLG